jgi:hypothetical protein
MLAVSLTSSLRSTTKQVRTCVGSSTRRQHLVIVVELELPSSWPRSSPCCIVLSATSDSDTAPSNATLAVLTQAVEGAKLILQSMQHITACNNNAARRNHDVAGEETSYATRRKKSKEAPWRSTTTTTTQTRKPCVKTKIRMNTRTSMEESGEGRVDSEK